MAPILGSLTSSRAFGFVQNIIARIPSLVDRTFTTFDTYSGFVGGPANVFANTPDGKTYFAGGFTSYNGITANRIARLNPDGSLDNSFNTGTGFSGSVSSITVQSDGKVVVVGGFSTYNGQATPGIVRLNSDGTIDFSFNSGSGFNFGALHISRDQSGRFVIVTNSTLYNGFSIPGSPNVAVIRLNSNGSLDTSFTSCSLSTFFTTSGAETVIQTDNKVIVFGGFTLVNGSSSNYVVRLNQDGSRDNSFSIGSGFNNAVRTAFIESNGRIIFGGDFASYNGTEALRVIRLNSDGSRDGSFGVSLSMASLRVMSVTRVPSSGKLLLGGNLSTTYSGLTIGPIIRLNTDFSLDQSFNLEFTGASQVSAIFLKTDENIIARDFVGPLVIPGGIRLTHQVLEITPSGTVPDRFKGQTLIGNPRRLLVDNNGRLIISGILEYDIGNFALQHYRGLTSFPNNTIRLNSDGTLDTSFTPLNVSNIQSLSVQSDNKILVTRRGSVSVQRYNENGSIDSGFSSSIFLDQTYAGQSAAIQLSDGKIFVYEGNGEIWLPYINSSRSMALLNSNGTFDTSFNPAMDGYNDVFKVQQLPNGQILLAGQIATNIGGVNARRLIARLNLNGTFDQSFNANPTNISNFETIRDFFVQPDGKVIVGGTFTSIGGGSANRIARLNTNGSLDTSFNVGTGINGEVRSINMQSDGKIVIAGAFGSYNGVSVNRIARLNPDGSLDTQYRASARTAFNNIVHDAKMISGNRLVAIGDFSEFDQIPRNRIARILPAEE